MFTIKPKAKQIRDDSNCNKDHRFKEKNYCYPLKQFSDSSTSVEVKSVITKHGNLHRRKLNFRINKGRYKKNIIEIEKIPSNVIRTSVPEDIWQTHVKRKMAHYDNEKKKHIKTSTEMDTCKLPVVSSPQISSPNFESISIDTLVETIEKYAMEFSNKFMLIDCRFPYQYKAGHIKGAVNFYDIYEITNFFFPQNDEKNINVVKKVPIFYYTESKEPLMISKLREIEGEKKEYPNIYLLDGGYEKFYMEKIYHKYCDPCGYVKPSLREYLKDKSQMNKKRREKELIKF
uniref:protein-tyrosine-phosphatase n=1 Tax=Strongyloides venezuelensis TaxID=75913 RepID=A0A0K0F6G1_STRVS